MPKRRSGERDGGLTAKRQRQHLYLAFDDWSGGYSIRKVDLSSLSKSGNRAMPQRLSPAVFRFDAPRGLPQYFASAFGTRILAMHPGKPLVSTCLFPVFDVVFRGIFFGPRPKVDQVHPIYILVGDRLFALAAGSFGLLYPPTILEPRTYGIQRSPWSWYELLKPPFEREHVTSYAVHPDGRSILVSTESGPTAATFTLDTEAPHFLWKQLGKWTLPFTGRGHFDVELDAFVGLSIDPDTFGHIYSCDAVSPDTDDAQSPAPARKLSKERLFSEEPDEVHVGATLVYLGSRRRFCRRRFCLMQCIYIEDECVDDELVEEEGARRRRRHLFRLTTFSLKYDKNGDLTTGKSHRVHYYKIPKKSTEFLLKDPVAFWL